MKTIFTVEGISKYNFGLFIIRDDETTRDIKDERSASYAATVAFKLIYKLGKQQTYGLCNFLTDGWCYFEGTKDELVNHLNNDRVGYRILSKEDLDKILSFRSNLSQLFYK